MIEIGFLIFPNIQQLDFTGPYEVFASAPDVRVHLVWKTLQPVLSVTGLPFTATVTLQDCPKLDVFVVPGGRGVNALLQDDEIINFLRSQASSVRYLTSVCTGSVALGAAGLLKGKRATTHWSSFDLLPQFGAIPVQERVVVDGNLITAGGITSGIDFGLVVLTELLGRSIAEKVQLMLEYDPSPPFHCGTPSTARPEIVAEVRQDSRFSREERERFVAEIIAKHGPFSAEL